VDFVQWCFLAGPSGAIRSLTKRVPLVPHLDERRHLRPHPAAAAGPTEGGGAGGFGHLVYRLHKRQGLPSRSGSEKGGCEALGRSRGGFSTKLHLVCDGLGNPLAALLTPGQQHESTVCTELLASVRVRTSAGGGRPRIRPKVVVADRGYDAGAFRRYLRRRGIRCVIPEKRIPAGKRRRRRGRPPTFCRTTYCQRNMVERLVGWLKEHRRIATRFEKLTSSFLAMVKLSFVRRYFRMLERFSGST
jgi:transposase